MVQKKAPKNKLPAASTKARPPTRKKVGSSEEKALRLPTRGLKAGTSKAAVKVTTPKVKSREEEDEVASETTLPTIDVGDRAPSFVLPDHTGTVVSSESLRGSPYVIYFYPKDDTPGCTLQACSFRDSMPRFSAKGVRIVGVSPDSPQTHERFRKKYALTFPLLSDPEKTLAKAYGVWVKKLNYGREYMGVQRTTFYVDRHGIVKKVWRAVRVPGHVDTVIHSI